MTTETGKTAEYRIAVMICDFIDAQLKIEILERDSALLEESIKKAFINLEDDEVDRVRKMVFIMRPAVKIEGVIFKSVRVH